jgi:hypothetical protein
MVEEEISKSEKDGVQNRGKLPYNKVGPTSDSKFGLCFLSICR